MIRGLVSGMVWGAILGAAGLGFVSLMSPVPPTRAKDVAAAVDAVEAQEAPADAAEPAPEPEPAAEPEPAPAAEPAAATEDEAADAAEPPAVAAEAPEPEAPPASQAGAEVSVPGPLAEATAEPAAAQPEEPGSPEAPPTPEGAAPLPPRPETSAEPAGPGAEAGEESVAVLLPESGGSAAPPASPEAPAAMAPEASPAAVETPPAPLPQIVEAAPADVGDAAEADMPAAAEPEMPAEVEPEMPAAVEPEMPAPAEPEMPAEVEPEPPAVAEAEAPAEPAEEAQAEPGPATPEAGVAPRIAIGQQAGFGNLAPDVRVNRFSRNGDLAAAEPTAVEEPDEAGMAEAPGGALELYAARFENPGAKPLLSLVVLDIGVEAGGLDRAALADFPFPVSFAIPADRPDAGEAAKAYRDAGFEVVMLAGALPQSATPADLEVSFEAFRAAVPEAVAVLDAPDGGFQGSRPLSAQVVAILGAGGQGLLTYDRGLNSAAQIAQREGVPSAMVFRDLDPDPQEADSIRRTLDRAALRAVQEGRVIVLARSRPDTVSALFAWAL
ncbi:MAG: divergent polysaccharide deacetylase family protein, partial [Paracoccaceae bacterium]|nr:divergent polysaccharide deacetylase family protein [Paracoccaceae bacterium]